VNEWWIVFEINKMTVGNLKYERMRERKKKENVKKQKVRGDNFATTSAADVVNVIGGGVENGEKYF
jgi:hypothetical protein